jgi:hypothetical protein
MLSRSLRYLVVVALFVPVLAGCELGSGSPTPTVVTAPEAGDRTRVDANR